MRGLLILLFFWIQPERAEAYLDSGSASMILQLVVSAAVGIVIYFKMNWQKLTQKVGKFFRK